MNRIKKYIPNVCGGLEREGYNFSNLNELMNTPIMKRTLTWNKKYLKNANPINYVSRPYNGYYVLECQYIKNGEYKSYIVGELDNTEGLK
jgi:hypothetical protein